MSTLIVLIPVVMLVIATIVVFVREGQFQQLSAMLEARHSEMTVLKKDVAAATANALSALQRVSETQLRLEAAEAESVHLREKLGTITGQLGQERLRRAATDEVAREFKARSRELELRCLGLEQQCRELVSSGQATEARAVAAEAEAADLRLQMAQLLQEMQQLRLASRDGSETAERTAAAAAQVARVERAIHAQAEELLAALDVLRREAGGVPTTDDSTTLTANTPAAETHPLVLHDESADAVKSRAVAAPELEVVRALVPHADARLTWAQPDQMADRQREAVAS